MYKTFLILTALTLSLTSCYTQFSAGGSSTPYIPDVQKYNYNADNYDEAYGSEYSDSDYYDGQYEPTNETEYNIYYYGSPWYSDYYYYPSWGFYTGWYSPYYSPGFICYPAYPNYCWNDGGYYTPIERTPRPFNKGRENRELPKKKRTPRPPRGGNTSDYTPQFTDLSSGNIVAVKSGNSGSTKDISSSRPNRNKGHVIAALPSDGRRNLPKSKRVNAAAKRSKKRPIHYTPRRNTSKSTARRTISSPSKSSGNRDSSSHKSYSPGVRSGGNSSSYIGSRSGSSSSVHRSSSVRRSSSSSSRSNSSASKLSSRPRRRR